MWETSNRRPTSVARCAVNDAPNGLKSIVLVASLLIVGLLTMTVPCSAQSPGDFPSADAIQRAAADRADRSDGLPIGSFMVLDKSGNLVYLPGMTYERWRELESGGDSGDQAFVFEPLEIKGTASDGRAELNLTLELTVEPTDGQFVSIPLKMANFFLLRAPEFASSPPSSSNDTQFIQPSKDGMVLKVRSTKRRKLTVRMSVSALVQSGPNRLDFQLPNLPTNIQLTTDLPNRVGEVIGSGSEVFQTKRIKNGGTRFDIATGGGSLTLQWSPAIRSAATSSLLESDSVMLLNWGSPQDQPIASVTLSLRSMRELKGPISSFEVDLPPGSVLLDTPTLDAKDQVVSQAPVKGKPNRVLITIPEQERSQRVAIRLELQLANDDATQQKPLQLQVPRVVGALQQQGEIQIQTSSSYRLRWRSSPWVRSFLAETGIENPSTRAYQFRFDRGEFVLPIWLSANKRQLLANSESLITLRDNTASLQMEIQFSGRATDSRSLELDLSNWRLLAVIDADTDDTLPWFETNGRLSIEMNTSAETLPPIKIFAQRPIFDTENDSEQVAFLMPRVVRSDQSLAIGASNVQMQSVGKSILVVNMDQSSGLERAPLPADDEQSKIATSRFRILDSEVAAAVVGAMVQQPPQITLASQATIVLSGDQLTTAVDWSVNPQTDLAGSLPVRVPVSVPVIDSRPTKGIAGRDTSPPTTVTPKTVTPKTVGEEADGDSADDQEADDDVADDDSADDIATGGAATDDIATDGVATDGAATDGRLDDTGSDDVGQEKASDHDVDEVEDATESEPPVQTTWSVTVDNVAAQLKPLGGDRFQLISDRLGIDPVVIRWRQQELIPRDVLSNDIHSLRLPVPALADVTVRGDVVVSMEGDSDTNLFAADLVGQSQLKFQSVPDRVRVRMTKLATDQNELSFRKAVLRSAVGNSSRYEQFLALIQGGDVLDFGLPSELGDIKVEGRVDQKRTPVSRIGDRLRVSLPGDRETHRVDLRIWVDEPTGELTEMIQPILQLPIGTGRVYWQVITPRDLHVVWAAPTVGRAMDWRFDFSRWSLSRQPIYSDNALTQWVNVSGAGVMPPGNRYLYIGSDVRSFSAYTMSRATLWLIVGGLLLGLTWMLRYVPASRNPLTAVAGAVIFAGLVALAPDAAVLAGQLSMIALILVLVMLAVGSLLRKPTSNHKTTASPGSVSTSRPGNPSGQSTRTVQALPQGPDGPNGTRSVAPTASEAAP